MRRVFGSSQRWYLYVIRVVRERDRFVDCNGDLRVRSAIIKCIYQIEKECVFWRTGARNNLI